MSAKHTPGPWMVDEDPTDSSFFAVWTDTGGVDATLAESIGDEANAHLMAAAPDLLAALEELMGGYDPLSKHPPLVRARAAIAKAEGAR